jgi:hypothetical protein
MSSTSRQDAPVFCGLALGAILLLAADGPPRPAIPFGGTDFKQYYATSQLLLRGENPYDADKVGEIQRALGAEGEPQVPYGPPTSLLPFIPLGNFDFATAVRLQLLMNVALLVASGGLWGMMLAPERRVMLLIGAASFVAWEPSLLMLGMGHVTGWTLFGFTAWCALMRRGQGTGAGAALALSIVKPHLAFALVGYAVVHGLRHRQRRMLAAFAAAVIVMCVVTVAIRPTIWGEYASSLPQSNPIRQFNATLDGWGRYQFGNWFRIVSLGATLTLWGVLARMAWTKPGEPTRWVFVVAVSLAAAPYAFSYDYVLLLPSLIFAIALAIDSATHRWWVIAGWLGLILFYYVGRSQNWNEIWYFAIPWAGLALTVASLFSRSSRASRASRLAD